MMKCRPPTHERRRRFGSFLGYFVPQVPFSCLFFFFSYSRLFFCTFFFCFLPGRVALERRADMCDRPHGDTRPGLAGLDGPERRGSVWLWAGGTPSSTSLLSLQMGCGGCCEVSSIPSRRRLTPDHFPRTSAGGRSGRRRKTKKERRAGPSEPSTKPRPKAPAFAYAFITPAPMGADPAIRISTQFFGPCLPAKTGRSADRLRDGPPIPGGSWSAPQGLVV